MKKNLYFLFIGLISLGFVACSNDDEGDDNTPQVVGKLTITKVIDGNKLTVSAKADNAIKYAWDFGNGKSANTQEAITEYKMADKYWVKCTASGSGTSKVTDSVEVNILVGDPSIYNEVAFLLTGYNTQTGESSAEWVWTDLAGSFSCGPKGHKYDNKDSVALDYTVDPWDVSWWQCGEGELSEDAADDVYSFKLNKTFDYSNEYGEKFVFNWAWSLHLFNAETSIWADIALAKGPKTASWSIDTIAVTADTLTATIINGVRSNNVYIVKLDQGAYLGIGAAGHEYQVMSISKDSLWIRYDNTFPVDMEITSEMEAEGVSGDAEWGYFKLVPKK